MNAEKFLSAEDQARIKEAVRKAELKTGGEIVPMVAGESDLYPEVPWRSGFFLMAAAWAVLGGFSVAGIVVTPASLFGLWAASDDSVAGNPVLLIIGVSLAAFLAGFFLAFLPPVRRLFVTRSRSAGEVRQAAMESFLDANIHRTKEHTGILIYLSLFERRVEIVADAGIHQALPDPRVWDDIVSELTLSIKAGKQGDGLVRAIERCGGLLSGSVPRAENDINELPDGVRLK